MEKVMITGATGFIGGALTKYFLAKGITVIGIDINKDKLAEMKQYGDFIPIVANFDQYRILPDMAEGNHQNIDVFYHFAWQGVFGEAFKDYRLQLQNAAYACDALMVAAAFNCKKFVLAGTYNQYEITTRMLNHYDSPRYTCIYASAKATADMMCKTLASNNNIEYNSGLICMAYGEGNYSKMLANVVINQLSRGVRPKLVEAGGQYDMIYIDDIVKAFLAIGEQGIDQKSYYIGHQEQQTFGEYICQMRDILNPDMDIAFGEYQEATKLDYSLIDRNALYQDTGFACQADFKASILKTADWVKSLNW